MRNSLTEDMDEFGKVGDVLLPVTEAFPIMTQRRAWQTSNLEDGEPLFGQTQKTEFSRMPIAPGKLSAMIHERRASAKRTHAG